jgi:hypothetical protein
MKESKLMPFKADQHAPPLSTTHPVISKEVRELGLDFDVDTTVRMHIWDRPAGRHVEGKIVANQGRMFTRKGQWEILFFVKIDDYEQPIAVWSSDMGCVV